MRNVVIMRCNVISVVWQWFGRTMVPSLAASPNKLAAETSETRSEIPDAPVHREPEWTIQNTKLKDFHPVGLEIDTVSDDELSIDNPYITNPVQPNPSVEEHERPWHEFKFGTRYFLPNDTAELSRLDRQHAIWRYVLDGDLSKAPVEPKHVLDLGTGSGIWAVEFAKEHPDSKVLGIDLSLPTLEEIPANCEFQQRDFMDPWNYPQRFEYIHGRLIFVAQSDPRRLLQQAYDSLAPGGYLEFHELYGVPLDVDGSLSGRTTESFFFNTVCASRNLGNDMLTLPKFAGWMQELGFENVFEDQRALPVNTWAKGRYKAVGAMQNENLKVGMGGIYTRMLTKGLGWTPEYTKETIGKVVEDVKDKSLHAYFPVFVVYGRKPVDFA